SAGIEDSANVFTTQVLHRTGKSIEGRGARVEHSVEEAAFQRHEWAKGMMTHFKFGSEEAVKEPDVGALKRHTAGGGVGEALGKDLVEVIAHFAFELQPAIRGDGESPSESGEVGVVCLGETEVVGEDADLKMIFFGLSASARYSYGCDACEQNQQSK